MSMGTFRFNLFYFSGIILMDVFAMIFSTPATAALYTQMAIYLHLSLILAFAVSCPDSQFLILFIIPVKAWLLSLVYLAMILIDVFNLTYPVNFFPANLFPLVGLANFLLFTGKDVLNLLPPAWRPSGYRTVRTAKQKKKTGTIPFPNTASAHKEKQSAPYTHRCTVCGRTDVTNPELEFRYCSKCNGYYCYCEDHINNHNHVE